MLKLVKIDEIQPSTYNPRMADPARLDIIELSLRKLGFLLPIYADSNGEILSGHQRHHVATRMGLTHVPVCFTAPMSLEQRKAINIAFNRGTNDLSHASTTKNMVEALRETDAIALANALPDIPFDDHKRMFRCMHAEKFSTKSLVAANSGKWVTYSFRMAKMMASLGVSMPVVITDDMAVVNGIGRLQYYAERKDAFTPVVIISKDEQRFSNTMLNLLSMDFDLHNRYRDTLRYNSFRRARRVREDLGLGFIFIASPNTTSGNFDVTEPKNAAKWKRIHGLSVVDFGAGHLHETNILRSIGVDVTPFEPYRLGANEEINKEESLQIARRFLETIGSGKKFSSVFISSVLNSVPFAEDRSHIACLCAALCDSTTTLYAHASGADHMNLKQVKGYDSLNKDQSTRLTFLLEYESNVTLADFKEKPKVQKYHTPQEFYELFKPFFGAVKVSASMSNVHAVCVRPKPVDPARLRKAIEFEFDLPYPDGSRMGLVDEAIAAYEKRLGVKL